MQVKLTFLLASQMGCSTIKALEIRYIGGGWRDHVLSSLINPDDVIPVNDRQATSS